jgi:hypothetical protein
VTLSPIKKKFEKEIVFESSVLAWIRIRIEQKCWIRIHNPDKKRYRIRPKTTVVNSHKHKKNLQAVFKCLSHKSVVFFHFS